MASGELVMLMMRDSGQGLRCGMFIPAFFDVAAS